MEADRPVPAGWEALKKLVWNGLSRRDAPLRTPLYASRDLPWPHERAKQNDFVAMGHVPEPMSDEEVARLVAALPRRSLHQSMPDEGSTPRGRDAGPWQPGNAATRPDPGMERALASALARLRALTEQAKPTNPRW